MAKSGNRLIWIVLGGIALLALLFFIFKGFGHERTVQVSTEKVQKRDVTEIVASSGKVYPQIRVDIIPDVTGEIIGIYVKEGDSVSKGQLLAKIKAENQEAAIEQARAAVNSANADLANSRARVSQLKIQVETSKSQYDRTQTLYDKGIVSLNELENVRLAYQAAVAENDGLTQTIRAAKARLQSAQATLREARANLGKTSLTAPSGGIVSAVNYEVGSRVSGIMGLNGDVLMTIADLKQMQIEIKVSENEVVRIKKGDSAHIFVQPYPDETILGIVSYVAFSASGTGNLLESEGTSDFEVQVRISPKSFRKLKQSNPGNNYPLKSGLSADVEIFTRLAKDAITVPVKSVTGRAEDEDMDEKDIREVVFVIEEGRASLREIKTGIQDQDYIEVKEGLELEEEVVSGSYNTLANILEDSMRVKVVDEDKLFD